MPVDMRLAHTLHHRLRAELDGLMANESTLLFQLDL